MERSDEIRWIFELGQVELHPARIGFYARITKNARRQFADAERLAGTGRAKDADGKRLGIAGLGIAITEHETLHEAERFHFLTAGREQLANAQVRNPIQRAFTAQGNLACKSK